MNKAFKWTESCSLDYKTTRSDGSKVIFLHLTFVIDTFSSELGSSSPRFQGRVELLFDPYEAKFAIQPFFFFFFIKYNQALGLHDLLL